MKEFCNNVKNSSFAKGVMIVYQYALYISGVVILVGMVGTVLLRSVIGLNMFGVDEVILCVVFWFYFLGSVNGSREDSHIRADVINVLIKNERVKWGIRLVTRAIEILAIIFLFVLSMQLWMQNYQLMPQTTGLRIPFIVPQAAIVLGFLLMLIYNFGHWLESLANPPAAATGKDGDQ